MGTKTTDKAQDAKSKSSLRDKLAAKKSSKHEAQEIRIDDFIEDNSVRGEDYLQELRDANPSFSPKQLNPVLQREFVTAYCDSSTDRQKQISIELFVLTSIALYQSSEPEVIRKAIAHMDKSIRAIAIVKIKSKAINVAKKAALPALEIAIFFIGKKLPTSSRLAKWTKVAAVGVPMVKGAMNGRVEKSDAEVERDERQAYKVIDGLRPIIGKLPKSWPEA